MPEKLGFLKKIQKFLKNLLKTLAFILYMV